MITKSRTFLVVLVLGLVSTGVASFGLLGRSRSPGPPSSRPNPAALVVSLSREPRAPDDPQLASQTIAFWASQAERDPQGAIELRELAGAYLTRFREASDIADAVRAEDAARRSLKILPRGNSLATTRLARSLLAQHRFPEALKEARRAASADPQASRLVADVLLELGDYDEAGRALAGLRQGPNDLSDFTLRARFELVDGRPEAALRLLRESQRLGDERPDLPAEVVAWYHAMIGHALTELGRLDEGEKACRDALDIFPRDYRALTGLAEIAGWRGDWPSAIAWGEKALAIATQNPTALRVIGDAHAALGREPEAERYYQRLKDLAHSFPRIYDRQWAMFCADQGRDLDEALTLARKDRELRHDIRADDTLAWVYFQKGMISEAESAMKSALARGTKEASILYHAGLIARASGDLARAKGHFQDARAMNPRSIPLRWIQWMESRDD